MILYSGQIMRSVKRSFEMHSIRGAAEAQRVFSQIANYNIKPPKADRRR